MKRIAFVVGIVLLAATGALAQSLPEAATERLNKHGRGVAAALSQALAGRMEHAVVKGREMRDAAGREVVWRVVKDGIDNDGLRHVVYQQYLLTPEPVELSGSGVILHYDNRGALMAANGRQFRDVRPSNKPRFTAGEAPARARARLELDGPFQPESVLQLTEEKRAHFASTTTLKIVQLGDQYRFAYFTVANDVEGVPHDVVIDAETAEVLASTPSNPGYNCNPTEPWQSYNAQSIPVRPELSAVRRSLKANYAPYRPYPFNYEGFYYNTPAMSVLQETATTAFLCDTNATRSYTLFPLMTDSGVPVYRDRAGYEWRGNAAGDALFNTNETMRALATMGRSSWNGSGGDANIIVESTFVAGTDNAYFINQSGGDPRLPPTRAVIINPSNLFYNLAAGLDIVAHEWGHGVIFTSSNFDRNTLVGRQLHEGFADVIGQAVEKTRQLTGTGLERSSDWHIGEDASTADPLTGVTTYIRSGEVDDQAGGHLWRGPNGSTLVDHKMHREDDLGENNTFGHDRGNQLNVAFRLLASGGTNPVCTRISTAQGCGTTMTGIGFTKARAILFDALQWYLAPGSQWADLADAANLAAYSRYNKCGVDPYWNASAEQAAVDNAFTRIGYPRLGSELACLEP